MITYHYTIQATKDVNSTYEDLHGVIISEYQLPYSRLREIAMSQSPVGYISFGIMYVEGDIK